MSCTRKQLGFGLIEMMVAVLILTIGLLGLAAILAQFTGTTNRARVMALESVLSSEKLEDLNRRSAGDPAIFATAGGGISGSLTADVQQTVAGQTVYYYDSVQVSAGDGAMLEIIKSVNAAGVVQFTTVEHKPDGTMVSTTAAAPLAAPSPDMLQFDRRWVIEESPAGLPAGLHRITCMVTLQNGVGFPITFQNSLVRP